MFKDKLTFANVMSMVAVFIALGGSSYAAFKLKPNSVTSAHIKNGAVAKRDLHKNSVDSSKVVNGSLLPQDFRAGTLPAGSPGLQGERGPAGPAGSVDTSNFYDKAASDDRFLGKTATATDSSALGGVPGANYAQAAGGRSFMAAAAVGADFSIAPVGVAGHWSMHFACTDPTSLPGALQFQNTSNDTLNVFYDNGGTNPSHLSMAPHSITGTLPTDPGAGGDAYDFDIQGFADGSMFHVRVLTLERTTDCHFQMWSTQMTGS